MQLALSQLVAAGRQLLMQLVQSQLVAAARLRNSGLPYWTAALDCHTRLVLCQSLCSIGQGRWLSQLARHFPCLQYSYS